MAEWIKSFDEQLKIDPPLSDGQLARIPAKRGLFVLLASDDKPVILLTAADMRARLRNRLSERLDQRRTKAVDLRQVTRKVLWKLTASHFESDMAFLSASRKMWPDCFAELLAWKPAWLVCVDLKAEYPHFFRTQDPSSDGLVLGPFPDGKSASQFVGAIQDAYDLCRDYSCLRQSPNASPCAYAQMGRCLSPCNGKIPMDRYRKVVGEAAEFAAGRRDRLRSELIEKMNLASVQLEFERAAAVKARIDRLADFDKPAYRYVRPLEQFRYIIAQQGGSISKVRVFISSRGLLRAAGTVDYPPSESQLNRCLKRMAALADRPAEFGRLGSLRMGLVASYLFSAARRRGLIVRYEGQLTAGKLAEQIEAARDDLKVRIPKPRKKRAVDKDKTSPTGRRV